MFSTVGKVGELIISSRSVFGTVLPRHIELSSVHSAENQQKRLPLMMDALAGRQHVVQDRLCFGCPCCEGMDSACHTDMV